MKGLIYSLQAAISDIVFCYDAFLEVTWRNGIYLVSAPAHIVQILLYKSLPPAPRRCSWPEHGFSSISARNFSTERGS